MSKKRINMSLVCLSSSTSLYGCVYGCVRFVSLIHEPSVNL